MLVPGRALQWILVGDLPVAPPSRVQLPALALWNELVFCSGLQVIINMLISYNVSPLPQTIQSRAADPFQNLLAPGRCPTSQETFDCRQPIVLWHNCRQAHHNCCPGGLNVGNASKLMQRIGTV